MRERVIEFEVKAPVPAGARDRVAAALGPARAAVEQLDSYLAHPCRDFAVTDEALRVRRTGTAVELTYKGPKLDATTKARHEATVIVGDADAARSILAALGFGEVAVVRKRRSVHAFAGFEASLDDVEGLGTFVELERALPDGAPLDAARADAAAALRALGLDRTERRSYLEMLLVRR